MRIDEKVAEQYAQLSQDESKDCCIEEESQGVTDLLSIYKEWLSWVVLRSGLDCYEKPCERAALLLRNKGPSFYSFQDAERFFAASLAYIGYSEFGMTGYFFSAVINNLVRRGLKGTYTIDVPELADPHDFFGGLCYVLDGADVRIRGKEAWFACENMKRGRVIIEGKGLVVGRNMREGMVCVVRKAENVGDSLEGGTILCLSDAEGVGYEMKGGRILVRGNVPAQVPHPAVVPMYLGKKMSGGTIRVKGVCFDDHACDEMTGGVVHFDNAYAGIADTIKGGEVYHRGTKVFP